MIVLEWCQLTAASNPVPKRWLQLAQGPPAVGMFWMEFYICPD